MTYNPRDAFTDVLSGRDAKQIAESITSELESASPKMIGDWFTEFVNMTVPSTRHISPWTDRAETYGGVTIRARPTTGPSRAEAPSGLEGYRLAAQGWLETFFAGMEPLEIQIVKAEKGAAPSDAMNAIEKYKALHSIVRDDNKLTIIALIKDINVVLINQPWYKAYVQHRAATEKPNLKPRL